MCTTTHNDAAILPLVIPFLACACVVVVKDGRKTNLSVLILTDSLYLSLSLSDSLWALQKTIAFLRLLVLRVIPTSHYGDHKSCLERACEIILFLWWCLGFYDEFAFLAYLVGVQSGLRRNLKYYAAWSVGRSRWHSTWIAVSSNTLHLGWINCLSHILACCFDKFVVIRDLFTFAASFLLKNI